MGEIQQWIDLVYPPRCGICGAFLGPGGEAAVCAECRGGLQEVPLPLCRRCGVPLETGPDKDRLCGPCLRDPPAYDAARALYVYEGAAKEGIHRFKYAGATHLAGVFGPPLAEVAEKWLPRRDGLLVVPVPLHVRRLRERGFNQSLLLARHVATRTGFPLDALCLRRVRETPPQAALGRDKRLENVRTAFAVKTPQKVDGRDVLLVDDVSTTGSTLEACSRALLSGGARRVYGLVLARARTR